MTNIITAIVEESILKKMTKKNLLKNKNIIYREAILDTVKKNK